MPAAGRGDARRSDRRAWRVAGTRLEGWLYVGPAVILAGLLILYPFGYNLWLSLFNRSARRAGSFVGLDNYVHLLSDSGFYAAAGRTAAWTVGVVAGLILAEQCASTAMIYLMHTSATQVLVAVLDFPGRDAVLRAIAAGRHLSTLAFSEKGSRSHFWAPISQVVIDGDKHRLNAEKSFVTSAGKADSYIVNTRVGHPAALTDQTLYFVSRDTPGLSVSGAWNGLGLRGNASAPMRLRCRRSKAATGGVLTPARRAVSCMNESQPSARGRT